ncbi:dTDP-4-dehydrorhamnose reductase [Sediminibacterium soli]|uniref:dTDP-4-dehydrorhamnose reductase n=1 Tax=Sediminibacterium soli TaxID=2698829 RepID=UPI00137A854C|nr:dTDP-4-dehydrorhamnose reductase [Sediminibacterium soli]NCI48155.1 dTDP-4-dehydrorhamnose reductase [Sediminibacterium soli]
MAIPLVAVSGSNGQLGRELQALHQAFAGVFDFVFLDRQSFDLGTAESINVFFDRYVPAYFINCAAYTAVDKAESDQVAAYRINAEAVGEIARHCAQNDCVLIHLSTDYVFNGQGTAPYQTDGATDPVNYYGYTKWIGEKLAQENNPRSVVIRTSWVYSAFGNNFVKTMLRLMKERDEISVVADQTGSPTYAADLAAAIMQIIVAIQNKGRAFGTYHYSNKGVITWYDFASRIRDIAGYHCQVKPIPGSAYPTPAKRPAYSVMDTSAIERQYHIAIPEWEESLHACLQLLTR